MIDIQLREIQGWESAVMGARNSMNSWDRSDSYYGCFDKNCGTCKDSGRCWIDHGYYDYVLGPNDYELLKKLAKAGSSHAKYRRMIAVWVDILAPLYWWKQFDTYKVGVVPNSCSTMHKIADKEFTVKDFSCEHLIKSIDMDLLESNNIRISPMHSLLFTIECLNSYRELYLETKDKKYWWQMIQLLPSSYNQKRTIMLNYETFTTIYHQRKNHKLDEWRNFCNWVKVRLPYSELITGEEVDYEITYRPFYYVPKEEKSNE